MVKIDLKDRKILYQLDLDSRQSLTQIGKKVGLKKDVVSYRIKRLQEGGIIRFFWTNINAYKLGYVVFRFYINYQYVTPDIKKNIIQYLVKDKHTWVVSSLVGRYDLSVVVWVKDINDFYHFWEKLLNKYGDYFAQKVFSIYVKAFSYPRSYLLLDEYNKSDREKYEIVGGGKTVEVDELDFQILNEIAENARISLIDLAEKINTSSQTINYRLKNLIKSGVIQGFRVALDVSKLGLRYYKVDVHLKEHSSRNSIINYIKFNPYVGFIATSAGVSDLEIEFYVKDSVKLQQIMENVNLKFPGATRNYEYFTVENNHKLRCVPEI
ncbi:MAG: Lrp/AsnC family transcriptional regulator [Thermoplasmatales archaeon]|nr:MAG: Lrp/AsnC family transcriptional regulator [Thermoplasmatales archaeon]